ncbi:AMP-binding protein [Candidatus Njordibacter sp. Uisw_056]|uniref:AMP-binding protein n=1 Tax=Candidatus Njordibacter sp. Uisw_056 TaxID=3230973 RepID=UPI003D49A05F
MTQIDGVELGHYQSVADVFLEACDKHAQKPAYSCMGQTLSFEDVERLTANFASYLQNHTDLEVGDRIAIQLPNVLQFPIAIFGAMRAGMVVVNTNPLYTAREMEHQFNDSGAKALLILANMAHLAEQVVPKTSIKHVIVTELADMHPFAKRLLINTVVKRVKKMVPAYSLPQALSFRGALALGAKKAPTAVALSLDDTAVLQYTGGTTGVSKGAQLLQKNLVSNMMQVRELIVNILDTDTEVVIAPLPLYHIYAFTVSLVMSDMGHELVLIPNPRDIPGFVKELSRHKFTSFIGLNTLFVALCNNKDFTELDFSHLKHTLSGGMALTEAAAATWKKVTACEVQEAYGLTETSPAVSFNPYHDIRLGTIGKALPGTQVKVISADGSDLGFNQEGELCVKGPQVMAGYWQLPEATAAVLGADGWLKTGDVAILAEDGFIRLVDRIKDMINVSGFNVYPNEIDDIASQHPGILECAAVGIPNEVSGETVKLFVVKLDPNLTEADVLAHCRENLTGYKVPKEIEFKNELPKTNVGKILRRALRD